MPEIKEYSILGNEEKLIELARMQFLKEFESNLFDQFHEVADKAINKAVNEIMVRVKGELQYEKSIMKMTDVFIIKFEVPSKI